MKRFLDKTDRKYFLKNFAIFLVVFTIVLIPLNVALGKLGEVRLFSGTDSIMEDMDYGL